MKKLLVMVIGAAAAFGASAALETPVGFESFQIGDTPTTNELNATTAGYWRDPVSATNTYTVEAMDPSYISGGGAEPAGFSDPKKALGVKTTFGNPLELCINANGAAQTLGGVYFDSLVKFTVCEEPPDQSYDGAKIVMWLQERYNASDDSIVEGTNLMVKAGFLTYANDAFAFSNVVYTCNNITDGNFADKWHRVTIKAIGDITEGNPVVPGFAIYIDGGNAAAETVVQANTDRWDDAFLDHYSLTEIARNLNTALFPSMVQGDAAGKTTLTSVGFDGTGSINDLLFTATAPTFADDEQYLDPKFTVAMGEDDPKPDTYKTVAAAIAAVNDKTSSSDINVILTLQSGFSIDSPITFNNADEHITIVLDLNGLAITNSQASTAFAITVAANTALTIKDSVGGGAIVSSDADYGAVTLGQDAVFVLESGKIDGFIDAGTGEVTLDGGTVDNATKRDVALAADRAYVAASEDGFWDIVPAFTVTFKDGDVVLTNILNVATNTAAADIFGIPADPTKAGNTFAGWSPALANTVIVSNTTFTAQWNADSYLIRFISGEGSTTNDYTKAYDETVTAPEPASVEGKSFQAWDSAVVSPVVGPATYTALYTNNIYTITFAYGIDHTQTVTANYEYGQTPTAPNVAIAVAGYNAAWPTFTAVTGVTTYEATYTPIEYTITFDANGGSVDPATTNYTVESGVITLPTPTIVGSTFNGWTNENITVGISTFEPGTTAGLGPVTLYAKWTALVPTPTVVTTDTVEGDTAADATAAANAAIVRTAAVEATGVTAEDYAAYFTKSTPVQNTETGKWEVKITIAETVQSDVEESAVTALTTSESTVTVPAGLYYKISASDSLPIVDANPLTELSDGNPIDVSTKKASSGTARFFKIELGASSFK